jgi:hypothetical protein
MSLACWIHGEDVEEESEAVDWDDGEVEDEDEEESEDGLRGGGPARA